MKYFKKSMLILLSWSLCATLTAQTSRIDSLEQVLATGKLKNPEKAELLSSLASAYLYIDIEKSREYAFEARNLAKDAGLKKIEVQAIIAIANTYITSDPEQLKEYTMEALQLAQNYGLKREEARAYFSLGNYYSVKRLPYQAHANYIKSEKIFQELGDKERLYKINFNLMIMFHNLKDHDNSLFYAGKVLEIATEQKDWKGMMHAQAIFGNARFHDNINQEALDFFLNLYHRIIHIEDSLGLRRDLSHFVGGRCIDIYIGMDRHQEALPIMHQMHKNFQVDDHVIHLGPMYTSLAHVHIAINNVDSAEYYINKAMDFDLTAIQKTTYYHVRAKIDSFKGDLTSALDNYQKYHHLNDSLSKEEKTTEMARLKLWHEFDQKETEKRILQQEFQKQRNLTFILTVSLIMTLALLALSVFFYRKITEKNSELEELHTVKDKLFSVVAHDLRNPMAALNSVLKLTHMNMLDAETQTQMLKDVSKRVDDVHSLLDNLLRWAKSQMQGMVVSPVTFDAQSEIRTVVSGLQEIAASKMVTLNNYVGNQEVFADRDMFSVVVRNLATNALKYTSVGGEVTIDSELSDNMLVVFVKDTGMGISQEVQEKMFKLSGTRSRRGTNNESGTGLGLVLCADFVKANGGNIWFSSVQDEGSTFFFSVPVNSEK